MKKSWKIVATCLLSAFALNASAADDKAPATQPAGDLMDLPIKLPLPAYKETPKALPPGIPMEKPRVGLRPATKAPKGSLNLAKGKPVTGSDKDPVIGTLDLITDGDKEAAEGSYVELARGVQWVQIDLGATAPIHAILLWHEHGKAVVYHAIVVQVSNDKDFVDGVQTVYNNDRENAAGQGAGKYVSFWETFEGKAVEIPEGVKGRYVRVYSAGNTSDELNRYTEIEVWGLAGAK